MQHFDLKKLKKIDVSLFTSEIITLCSDCAKGSHSGAYRSLGNNMWINKDYH